MLLMQGFGTLNTLVPGRYIFRYLLYLSLVYMVWNKDTNFNEYVQPPVDGESAKSNSAMLFIHLGEISFNVCNNIN